MAVMAEPARDQVALVTGANHGIGAAVAAALAARGADVVATFLRSTDAEQSAAYNTARESDGSATRDAVASHGRRCTLAEADLTDTSVITELFDLSERTLGPVSILVHNASGWSQDSFAPDRTDAVGRPSRLVTPDTIDGQLHVDARAGALLMSEFIRRHRERGATWGRIVTMTSGDGGAFPGEVSYGASKAALVSYTLSAAAEMAGDGVTANVVYPPVTDTGWIDDGVRAFVASDRDHHHIAEPDEVAETVAWLCADAGRLVTGNVIRLR